MTVSRDEFLRRFLLPSAPQGPKKPPQSEPSLTEARADSGVVKPAVGSSVVTEPRRIPEENEVELGAEDQEEEVEGELKEDPDPPG